MFRVLKRVWIPLVLVVVLSVAALVVVHLRGIFGSQDLNADANAGIQIVEFNPKILTYEVFGPAGTTASINYWDAEANTHQVDGAQLPWTYTISTTLSAVTANIMAQGDSDQIGCRVIVDHVVKAEETAQGVNAQTFCLVKSA